jgi:hypothetical protein
MSRTNRTIIQGSDALVDLADQSSGKVFDVIATLLSLLPGTRSTGKQCWRSYRLVPNLRRSASHQNLPYKRSVSVVQESGELAIGQKARLAT